MNNPLIFDILNYQPPVFLGLRILHIISIIIITTLFLADRKFFKSTPARNSLSSAKTVVGYTYNLWSATAHLWKRIRQIVAMNKSPEKRNKKTTGPHDPPGAGGTGMTPRQYLDAGFAPCNGCSTPVDDGGCPEIGVCQLWAQWQLLQGPKQYVRIRTNTGIENVRKY